MKRLIPPLIVTGLIAAVSLFAVVSSQITFTSGTTPGNPTSGHFRLWANASSGSLECLNSSGGSCLSTGAGIPGGLTTQLQWNSAGSFAGTSAAVASATRILFADGTAAAPGLSFSDGQTGFFSGGAFLIGTRDTSFTLSASGVLTDLFMDNDSIRCREGDEALQRGLCEIIFRRKSNNARFTEINDAGISWGDPAGGGSGTRVGIFRKTTDGASTTNLYASVSDGGALIDVNSNTLKTPGCTFSNLATCFGSTSGTHAYCTDCTVTSSIDNTATSGGSGCDLSIVNGAYKCTSL